MSPHLPHISVCICTYKRPDLLRCLLHELAVQVTEGRFTYSVVVADNDELRSAERVVSQFTSASNLPITYCVEPCQNIALTRNKAVMNAKGDLVAFIDDDEVPIKDWLLRLFTTLDEHHVDGVLGPVKPHYAAEAPHWVIKGRFYDRAEHPTGLVLDWGKCRTGNVLLKAELFAKEPLPFRPEFLSGEDQDFFRRMIAQGHVFVWCAEAVAYEDVPPMRWKRGFLVRRALFRGVFSQKNSASSLLPILESLVATPVYMLALPIALLLGQALFMSCVIRIAYHAGRLFAFVGINPIRQKYVTE